MTAFREKARVLAFNKVSTTQRELTEALTQGARDREQLATALDTINALLIDKVELKAANWQLTEDLHEMALEHVDGLGRRVLEALRLRHR